MYWLVGLIWDCNLFVVLITECEMENIYRFQPVVALCCVGFLFLFFSWILVLVETNAMMLRLSVLDSDMDTIKQLQYCCVTNSVALLLDFVLQYMFALRCLCTFLSSFLKGYQDPHTQKRLRKQNKSKRMGL